MIKNKKIFSFLFITVLSLLLIVILFFAHTRSTNSIRQLQSGNELAGRTFQINNALQEIVNDITTVEIEYQQKPSGSYNNRIPGVVKAVDKMKTNTNILFDLTKNFSKQDVVSNFTALINKKIAVFNTLADSAKTISNIKNSLFSLESNVLNDSIYVSALSIQIEAEKELQKKINQNFKESRQALGTSKALTLLAISAILLLATIIILFLVRNNKLIKDIELSKQLADKAANIKEQFLANMSHEIRTPVNSIIGFTNLLQKTSLQKDQSNFVSYIRNSGENLLYIVNDILDISKIEAGMLHLKKEAFNLNELCYYIEMMFYNESKRKQIDFTYSISNKVPEFIVGDEDRLKQILSNIVGNAFKFTNSGFIKLDIDAESINTGNLNLIFKVTDTGIGIPLSKIDVIFERFEQADSKTTKIYGGTGLGLNIVKKLVNMQGGQIWVTSEEGKGSVFTFTLPVQIPEEIEISELVMLPEKQSEIVQPPVNFPSNYTVLVAEDNKMNQILIQYILKQWNVKFKIVQNGKEVIECLKTTPFDIVLMDIQMPIMDGYQAASLIRKKLKSEIPIIAMTAFVMQGEKDKCFTYGMNEYLPKPINEIKLKELLIKYLPALQKNNSNTFINTAFLNDTFQQNTDFVKNVLSLFITQYPDDLNQLNEAVQERDIKKIRSLAHNLKSTVLSVNDVFPALADLQTLEEYGNIKPDWYHITTLTNEIMKTGPLAVQEAKEAIDTL